MRRMAMIINTAKERRARVAPDELADKVLAARVLFEELGDVVDEARDEDERPVLRLLLEGLPSDDGEVVRGGWPLEVVLRAAEALELHGELTLADFVIGEDLEMRSEADAAVGPDEPLSGVVLPPLDSVAVVHRELVVEVVVTGRMLARDSCK